MREILNKILNVSNTELDTLNTQFINQYNIQFDSRFFHLAAGREHYRILMYVSSILNKEIIFDVGTNRCFSAAALSFSMKNLIKSFDIKKILMINPILPRVQYIIGDATQDEQLIKSTFAFLDTDHDGIFENIFINKLREIKWNGILMLDDIKQKGAMTEFWNSISEEKYDLTSKGHWNGTGAVYFE